MPKKRKVKKRKDKKVLKLLISLIIGYIAFYNLYGLVKNILVIIEKKQEKKILLAEQKRLKEEEAYLKDQVIKFRDPDYLARYAREKYLFSTDGELIIKID